MAFEQLEIHRLSETGETLRRIRCLAGRVSVLRSNSEAELEAYKVALEGKPSKERFSILLDGGAFKPSEHAYIGFAEKFAGDISMTACDYLQRKGVQPATVEPLLLKYGLGGLTNARLSDMSSWQVRILRIIGEATAGNRIIFLHEPFEDVPERFREPIAELLTKYVWDKKGIVVVTKLSFRPEHWIENDLIARMQLERPRQRTIGFGASDPNTQMSIEAMRKELNQTPAQHASPQIKSEINLVGVQKPSHSGGWQSSPFASRAFMGLVLLSIVTGVLIGMRTLNSQQVAMVTPSQDESKGETSVGDTDDEVQLKSPMELHAGPQKRKVPVGSLIDQYPPDIRESWLLAYNMKPATSPPAEAPSKTEAAWSGNSSEEGPTIEKFYDQLVKE